MEFLMGNPKNIIPTERFLEKIRAMRVIRKRQGFWWIMQ